MNCGDCVENFTAAEYNDGNWRLCYHNEYAEELQLNELEIPEVRQLYQIIAKEFSCLNLI